MLTADGVISLIGCLMGKPVAAVPIRRPGAMPIGVQIIAPPWHERRALQVAARLEACGIAGSDALA